MADERRGGPAAISAELLAEPSGMSGGGGSRDGGDAAVDLGEGGLDLGAAHGVIRLGLLALHLGAGEPQRFELPILLGLGRRESSRGRDAAIELELVHPLLQSRFSVDESFSRVTHGSHYTGANVGAGEDDCPSVHSVAQKKFSVFSFQWTTWPDCRAEN